MASHSRVRDLAITGTIALTVCFLLYGILLTGNLPIGIDNTFFYPPLFSLKWDQGPPLWHPYSLAGAPAYDNLQFAVLYPLRWPFYFIEDWRSYYGLFSFLHYVVAAAGGITLLRHLGFRRFSLVSGVVVLIAGGHLAGRILNPTIFYSCCWTPLFLAGATGHGRSHLWISLAAMFMIASLGSPHILLFGSAGYLIVLFTQNEGISSKQEFPTASYRKAVWPFIGLKSINLLYVFFGGCLAAPSLIPGIMRAGLSIRTQTDVMWNLRNSVRWSELAPMFFGGSGGAVYPEQLDKTCFVGSIVMVGIGWLLIRKDSWKDRRFLCGLFLVLCGLIFALGKNIGMQFVMPWLPGFRLLEGPARALILTAIGLSILAALAMEMIPAHLFCRTGVVFIAVAAASLLVFCFWTWNMPSARRSASAPFSGEWAMAWLVAPEVPGFPAYVLLELATGLFMLGFLILITGNRPQIFKGALVLAVFLQLWHFYPRVKTETRSLDFYDTPPQAAFLERVRQQNSGTPFRIASYDALRIHDGNINNHWVFPYLAPNLATLYRLEDIAGFEPLIHEKYLDLIKNTSGRALYNNPLRNIDIARPDEFLFDLLNVRYLIGHPYNRQLTTSTQTLTPANRETEVTAWDNRMRRQGEEAPANSAITHWLFVSLIDNAGHLPLGAEVARLEVEAVEGTFSFPVRNGIETADFNALNYPRLHDSPKFQAHVNSSWPQPILLPEMNYQFCCANYRAIIDFKNPLHVRRLRWRLTAPGGRPPAHTFHLAAQGYRFVRPETGDPWQKVQGAEDDFAPVFQYMNAKPRAGFISGKSGAVQDLQVERGDNIWNAASFSCTVIEYDRGRLALDIACEREGIVVLSEIAYPGWKARLNEEPVQIRKVNDILCGIEVPAGSHQLLLEFSPSRFWYLLLSCVVLIISLTGWELCRQIIRNCNNQAR